MRIAFFTNHYKTVFFNAISSNLKKLNHEIYWISTSRTWTKWLIDEGVEKSYILDITEFGAEWSNKNVLTGAEENELAKMEQISGLTINNIISTDRILRNKSHIYSRSCLSVARREIKNFLVENSIESVILEATWALELLTICVCKEIGCKNYCPHTIRIPDGRFAFFDGYLQSKVNIIREPDENDFEKAANYYDYFLNKSPKPDYMTGNSQTPRVRLNWIKKLFSNLRRKQDDPFDEMQPPPLYLVRNRLSEVWKCWNISLTKPFENAHLPPDKPYILYALHQQPEASIDVLGSYSSNQIESILAISRSAPSTHELYVKEHSVSIGVRPKGFYNAIKKIPRVRLINAYADSHRLITHADVVITVSGTIAYEAALYCKPAITLSSMFFGPILSGNGLNVHSDEMRIIINDLIGQNSKSDIEKKKQKNIDFLAWIIAQSFKGIISDPFHSADCMSSENLERVADAINRVLHLRARQYNNQPI